MAKRRFTSIIRMGASAFTLTLKEPAGATFIWDLPPAGDDQGRFEGRASRDARAKVHETLGGFAKELCIRHGISRHGHSASDVRMAA
ncbi:hypothetical protein [Methylobacterium marchantiae]|uniref:Uncharacterized protein n=1 Tax=Methylobacterium marchantiae TaxID=600331 RepID=A0ABW3X3E4_9HYPH|nr:hypothetical protein AIGOOFII_3464 [Methylobacterium marchantiae]